MPRAGDAFDRMLARQMGVQERTRITPENFVHPVGPADTSAFVRQIPPPWENPYPFSYNFNRNDFRVAIPAVIGAEVELVRFTLPPTYIGWLNLFGISITAPTANQDITFTLRINGGPVEGYDNWQFPPGVANFVVQNVSGVSLFLPDGCTVTITASNGSADAFTIGGKLSGWYHPATEEKRVYGSL